MKNHYCHFYYFEVSVAIGFPVSLLRIISRLAVVILKCVRAGIIPRHKRDLKSLLNQ